MDIITLIVFFTMVHANGLYGETHIELHGFDSLAQCEQAAETLVATLDDPDIKSLSTICIQERK